MKTNLKKRFSILYRNFNCLVIVMIFSRETQSINQLRGRDKNVCTIRGIPRNVWKVRGLITTKNLYNWFVKYLVTSYSLERTVDQIIEKFRIRFVIGQRNNSIQKNLERGRSNHLVKWETLLFRVYFWSSSMDAWRMITIVKKFDYVGIGEL